MILFYPFLAFLAPSGRFKAGESAGNYFFVWKHVSALTAPRSGGALMWASSLISGCSGARIQ